MRRISHVAGTLATVVSLCTLAGCAGDASSAPPVLTPSVGASYTAGASPSSPLTGRPSSAVTVAPSDLATSSSPSTTDSSSESAAASDSSASNTTLAESDPLSTTAVTISEQPKVAPSAPTLSKPQEQTAAPSPTVTSETPKVQLQPQAPKNPGSVNFASIDDVAVAAAFNACLVDASVDPNVDAATARARAFFLDDATLAPGKDCRTVINAARFAALKSHNGFVNVKVQRITLPGAPADQPNLVTRAFSVEVTPAGRDGWSEPAWNGAVGMELSNQGGRWIVDFFKVEAT